MIWLVAAAALCAGHAGAPTTDVVDRYVAAFNARDARAMDALVAAGARFRLHVGDEVFEGPMSARHAYLETTMFPQWTDGALRISDRRTEGPRVAQREVTEGRPGESSTVTYEVRDGCIVGWDAHE